MNFNPDYAYLPLIPNSKLPAIKDWVNLASKPGDLRFKNWQNNKFVDYGVATGKTSGILVLDIDVKSKGIETLKQIEEQYGISLLDYTYTVKTQSGGYHLYFRLQEGQTFRNRASFLPGWDLRGDGGYVKVYNDIIYDESPQPIPDLLLELIKSSERKTSAALTSSQGEVIEGGRNQYLTAVAGKLQRSNLLTFEALIAINERDCNPPLDEQEVLVIFNSISKYVPDETIVATSVAPVGFEEVYNKLTGKALPGTQSLVVRASDLSVQMIEYLGDKDKVKGEPTGITGLDYLLGGGHRLGEVTCWHAEAKVGKNTLWHKLMHLWLTRKNPVAIGYASRELTPETEVLPDLLSIHFQKNVRLENVKGPAYTDALAKWPLYFANGYGHFPFEDIIKWVLELKALGVQHFWFDHLHYMLEDPEEHKEASKLVKNIKSLAKSENINIQIIIQPNKLMEGQRLSLNSIKGGSAMGQAIDNLVTLERVRSETPNIMMLQTKACRSKLANIGKIYLQYNPQTIDMVEVEADTALPDNGPTHGSEE